MIIRSLTINDPTHYEQGSSLTSSRGYMFSTMPPLWIRHLTELSVQTNDAYGPINDYPVQRLLHINQCRFQFKYPNLISRIILFIRRQRPVLMPTSSWTVSAYPVILPTLNMRGWYQPHHHPVDICWVPVRITQELSGLKSISYFHGTQVHLLWYRTTCP